MKIDRIEIIPVTIPHTSGEHVNAYGGRSALHNVLVAVYCDEGLVGWGETAPVPAYTGDTQESVVAVLRGCLGPLLLGQDPRAVNALLEEMDRVLWSQSYAKSAVDYALHDLAARLADVPLVQMLGGCCRERFALAWTLGWNDTATTVAQAEAAVEAGFQALKVKIGNPDWRLDLERVRAVRDAVGDVMPIRVDANQGYTVPEAVRIVSRMASYDLQLVEQPIARWDFAGMRHVRRVTGVPLLADESASSIPDVFNLIREEAADIINIKPQKFGGLTRSWQVAGIAAAANRDVLASSRMCSGVGVAAAVHFYAALPNARYEGEFVDGVLMAEDDLLDMPIPVERGFVHLPQGAGTGVVVNTKRLRHYAETTFVVK
jgi:L-alanine-DL-glutamate epimerase-like enolase superfamily enzyme